MKFKQEYDNGPNAANASAQETDDEDAVNTNNNMQN